MLQEMAGLGFSYVELSHGTRITLVPGILKAVEEGVVKIGTTHNFCPLPTGVTQAAPNLFEPSTPDAREHEQWGRQTKRSLDFSAQVEAKVLVMHLGSAKFLFGGPGGKIEGYSDKHLDVDLRTDKKYLALRDKAVAKMRKRMTSYWERVQGSIEEVRVYAHERGINLGFENRENFHELPMDPDFQELLDGIQKPHTGGYWHDTGHAHIKESFALLDHRQQLERNAANLLGFHLHDVSAEGQDHQPIGSGKIDFDMVSSFWKPHHILVLEFSPRLSTENVLSSKAKVEELLEKRFGK